MSDVHDLYAAASKRVSLDVVKYAMTIPVTREMMADAADIRGAIDTAFDRHLNPWRYSDRNPFPSLDLFPRLTRLVAWWQRAKTARLTVVYGADQTDDWD